MRSILLSIMLISFVIWTLWSRLWSWFISWCILSEVFMFFVVESIWMDGDILQCEWSSVEGVDLLGIYSMWMLNDDLHSELCDHDSLPFLGSLWKSYDASGTLNKSRDFNDGLLQTPITMCESENGAVSLRTKWSIWVTFRPTDHWKHQWSYLFSQTEATWMAWHISLFQNLICHWCYNHLREEMKVWLSCNFWSLHLSTEVGPV